MAVKVKKAVEVKSIQAKKDNCHIIRTLAKKNHSLSYLGPYVPVFDIRIIVHSHRRKGAWPMIVYFL